MTALEKLDALGLNVTLRRFAKLTGGEPQAKPWRAAVSGHYYTSDTCRLAMADRDDSLEGEGWGDTPEEAASELLASMTMIRAARANGWRADAEKAQRELEDWLAKLG